MWSEGGDGYLHIGPGATARKDPGQSDEITLGMMLAPEVGWLEDGRNRCIEHTGARGVATSRWSNCKRSSCRDLCWGWHAPSASQTGSKNQEMGICGDGGIIAGVLGRTKGGGGGATKGKADEASS